MKIGKSKTRSCDWTQCAVLYTIYCTVYSTVYCSVYILYLEICFLNPNPQQSCNIKINQNNIFSKKQIECCCKCMHNPYFR